MQWGPHADVPEGLAGVAKEIPLVVLSNASDDQIPNNIAKLGCGPEDILHVSAGLRYDLTTAYDLGIKHKVYVNRGYEPGNPAFEYTEIKGINELPGVVGL